ncbi:MAG: diguanylate cyclase [Sinobacterium sp.]|nr:diguanylate cyclase [Sinobacterium sp.]
MKAHTSNLSKHHQPLHILIVDDHPEECERLKSAIENIPDSYYKLSVVDEMSALEKMSFYSYDLCIVDDKVSHSTASEIIKHHHLGEKLPTIMYGDSSLSDVESKTENEVHDVLSPAALNPESIEHVIQHAYTQFHFEKELAALAFTDELTSLASRRMFEYQLDMSLKRVERTHKPLSVALLNLDSFRYINEKFGHVIGDAALKYFSGLMAEYIRPYDCVARLADDNFAIIFEEANKAQAHRAVRDIENACQSGLFTNGLTVPLSCSTGLIECDNLAGLSVPMIMSQAETLLFDAKQKRKGDMTQKIVFHAMDALNESTLDEMSSLSKKHLH